MNGKEVISKLNGSFLTQAHIFGLPLTTKILIEVICNGWTSDDESVSWNNFNCISLTMKCVVHVKISDVMKGHCHCHWHF